MLKRFAVKSILKEAYSITDRVPKIRKKVAETSLTTLILQPFPIYR